MINYETFKKNYLNGTSRTSLFKGDEEFIGIWHNSGGWGAVFSAVNGDVYQGVNKVAEFWSEYEEPCESNEWEGYQPLFFESDFLKWGYTLSPKSAQSAA